MKVIVVGVTEFSDKISTILEAMDVDVIRYTDRIPHGIDDDDCDAVWCDIKVLTRGMKDE